MLVSDWQSKRVALPTFAMRPENCSGYEGIQHPTSSRRRLS